MKDQRYTIILRRQFAASGQDPINHQDDGRVIEWFWPDILSNRDFLEGSAVLFVAREDYPEGE